VLPGLQAAPAVAAAVLYSGSGSMLRLLAMILAACASMASNTTQLALAIGRVAVAAANAAASIASAAASGLWWMGAALAVLLARALMQHARVVYHSAVLLRPSTGVQYLVRTQSMSGAPDGQQATAGGQAALSDQVGCDSSVCESPLLLLIGRSGKHALHTSGYTTIIVA
jgi:hypothetical protein